MTTQLTNRQITAKMLVLVAEELDGITFMQAIEGLVSAAASVINTAFEDDPTGRQDFFQQAAKVLEDYGKQPLPSRGSASPEVLQ